MIDNQELQISEKEHKEVHNKLDHIAENVMGVIASRLGSKVKTGLGSLESELVFSKIDDRHSNGLSLGTVFGRSGERDAYDKVRPILEKALQEGLELEELPEVMRRSFDVFEKSRYLLWSKMEIRGVILASGVSLTGEYKETEKNDARFFPTDAGLWIAKGDEVVDQIIKRVIAKEGLEGNELEDRVRKELSELITDLCGDAVESDESVVNDCKATHDGKTEKREAVFEPFDDKTVALLKREKEYLDHPDKEWFSCPLWVVSENPLGVEEDVEVKTLVNPLTGGLMKYKWVHVGKGKFPPLTDMGVEELERMPENLAGMLKAEGWNPDEYYSQNGALNVFAVAENGAFMRGARKYGGMFGGFVWQGVPAGKIRFFRGFDPSDLCYEEVKKTDDDSQEKNQKEIEARAKEMRRQEVRSKHEED